MEEKQPLKPLPTYYQGRKFRSRLEARWAVFFDAVGIRWTYEPEGYLVYGHGYLPDYHLTDLGLFVEIKPELAEANKILYQGLADMGYGTLLLLQGSVWIGEYEGTLFRQNLPPIPGLVWAVGRCDHSEIWLARPRDSFSFPLTKNVNGDYFPLTANDWLARCYRHASGYEFWRPPLGL